MAKKDKEKQEKPAKVLVARLDGHDVYHGTEEMDAADVTPMHVPLPGGCDLAPGKYRWDRTRKTFLPLRDHKTTIEQPPLALNALALGFIALHAEGRSLPTETLDWLDYYISTMDFVAPRDTATVDLVRQFKTRIR